MNVNALFVSSVSATFELDNKEIYYNSKPFDVYLNKELVLKGENRNVFSLFNLDSDKEYTLELKTDTESCELKFKTLFEKVALNVKDFGAIGDGIHDDTKAIQLAIYSCPKDGRVYLEEGNYLVTSVMLKSNITIELKKNAVILGMKDRYEFPYLPGEVKCKDGSELQLGTWEGDPGKMFSSIVLGIDVENVKFVGEGTIDGNATFNPETGEINDWMKDHRTQRIAWRPRNIFLNNCRNIVFQGVNVMNSPAWTIHPYFSKNVRFLDLYIKNHKYSHNTDRCDPESCDGVDIIGVRFSVGDDCIAIKAGKIYMGMKYQTPCKNLTIRNCYMKDGHGGVVLGSEMSGGIKDLTVERCIFEGTDRGLRIKTRRGRGKYAIIDGVEFENILMDNVLTPLVVNMYYFCDPDGKTEYVWCKDANKYPVDERTPYIGRFHFKNLECRNAEVSAGFFYGLPEQPIESVHIENVSISFKEDAKEGVPAMMSFLEPCSKQGLYFNNVNNVKLENVKISGIEGEEVTCINVKELERE